MKRVIPSSIALLGITGLNPMYKMTFLKHCSEFIFFTGLPNYGGKKYYLGLLLSNPVNKIVQDQGPCQVWIIVAKVWKAYLIAKS